VLATTLSDFHGHSPAACLLKCDFSYACAAVDKTTRHVVVVPLR